MLNTTNKAIMLGLALSQMAFATDIISADSLFAARQKSYSLFQKNYAALSRGCGPQYAEFHSSHFYFVPGESQAFYSDYAGILMYIKSDGKSLKRVWCASLTSEKPVKSTINTKNTLWKVYNKAALGKAIGKLPEYQGPLELFGTIGTQSYTALINSSGVSQCYKNLGNIAYGNPYFAPINCITSKPKRK